MSCSAKNLLYSGYFAGEIDPVLCVAGKMKYICCEKNRTQPKNVWREAKGISSSEISRDHFLLSAHFETTLLGHTGHQVLPIKATS